MGMTTEMGEREEDDREGETERFTVLKEITAHIPINFICGQ